MKIMQRRRPGPSNAELGEALRSIVRDRGVTQDEAAQSSGIYGRTFARYLAGDTAMPASAMLALAAGLGMTAGELADAVTATLERASEPASQPASQPAHAPADRNAEVASERVGDSARPGDDDPTMPSPVVLEAMARARVNELLSREGVNEDRVAPKIRRRTS